jgi:hypothetical protein
MGQLKILAGGKSPQAQAQARGKLFEKLMAEVLRHYGYSIDQPPNTNYAGMEIDIEGKHIATGVSLYAECKCYENDVDTPKLHIFFSKYITQWFNDERCHGIFVALPGINSHAKGFYKEKILTNSKLSFRVFEEKEVLDAIIDTPDVVNPEFISKSIHNEVGKPGDWLLLYTDKGLFWLQYVIPPGEGIANSVAMFDKAGNPLSDGATIEYLKRLWPELEDFTSITFDNVAPTPIPHVSQDRDEVVEVKGSSAPFEYQFPASPEYFVGRYAVLEEIDSLVEDVINKKTSSRSILFKANSGWGKSSVVLAAVNRIQHEGHFAVAIDSRSASSSQFVLRMVDYVLHKFGDFNGMLPEGDNTEAITGFEGAVDALVRIGQLLERNHKVVFIFLDQFENLFFLPDVLKRIKELFLKIQDAQTNVVLGFSWKSDLVGVTSEFPYQTRDIIADSSKRITLDAFSKEETDALLDKLRTEIGARGLRNDLRFLLSESSQGYPWLLKKLCAHVKFQIEQGISQADVANSFLNVEELFREDLRGLSVEKEDALRRIAKVAPINIQELGEEFSPEVFQSLIHRRLLVRIGIKYDIYWDIFRDYLNTGQVPVQDNYMLRAQVGSVLNATKLFVDANEDLSMSDFEKLSGLTKNSAYNVLRDMRLIGLVKVDKGIITLLVNLPDEPEALEEALRGHLQERLKHNRLIWRLSNALGEKSRLTIDEISRLLEESCPYISATQKTWGAYARTFAAWMDSADLAISDANAGVLSQYTPGTGIRDRRLHSSGRRRGMIIPSIQYTPIENVIIRLVDALQKDGRVDWSDIKPSTLSKALSMLEGLEFVERKTGYIEVMPKTFEFVSHPDKRPILFAEGALKIKSFETFIGILKEHTDTGLNLSELGTELRKRLGVNWKNSTAEWTSKIMLNWARRTGLAPSIFANTRRESARGTRERTPTQTTLFDSSTNDDREVVK